VDVFAIKKNPVLVFAMLAETFAVIGEEDDERAVVDSAALQEIDKLPDNRVGRRDFAVVGTGEAGAERFRWRVRCVRLEEVEKKIELILADAKGQPRTEPFEIDEQPDDAEAEDVES